MTLVPSRNPSSNVILIPHDFTTIRESDGPLQKYPGVGRPSSGPTSPEMKRRNLACYLYSFTTLPLARSIRRPFALTVN